MVRPHLACLALAALVLLCVPAWAGAGAPLPEPGGWVCDYAGVLDQENRQKLYELCMELEKQTSAELAVVTVRTTYGEPIESYANRLFNTWGIGKEVSNNGVLLLFAMEDRRMRLEVGRGLEVVLPDATCQAIIDDTITPFFKRQRYGDGAYAGAADIAQRLSRYYNKPVAMAPAERPPRFAFVHDAVERVKAGARLVVGVLLLPALIVLRIVMGFLGFGRRHWWDEGGGFGGGWSSGFGGGGGFGGGSSGGGGASGSW